LRDSPNAFTSAYQREAAWREDEWRARLAAAVWVVAIEAGFVIGIAGLVAGQPPHDERHIESIWVAPRHRRRGVFRSLVGELAEIGRGLRLRELPLWVLEENTDAWQAYQRVGFVPTGERQTIGPDQRYERRLRLALTEP
jgi:ribosomal protein S18 acetylase RimI-like enzyme